MNLAYFAADTLGITMYQTKTALKGQDVMAFPLGPWRMGMTVKADSDILSGREMGFWVGVGKALTFYLVVREKESWLFLLNPQEVVKILVQGDEPPPDRWPTKARVEMLKPAIRAAFHNKNQAGWEKIQYDSKTIGG